MPSLNIGNLTLSGNIMVEPLVLGPTFSVVEESKISSSLRSFGFSTAGAGNSMVVGAYSSASIAVYDFVEDRWIKSAEYTKTGRFGMKVAITDDWVATCDNPASGNGSVWIYRRTGARTWSTTEFVILTAPAGVPGNGYGASVALSGNTLVVGHRQANGGVGGAHVYVFNGTSWILQGSLLTASLSQVRTSTAQNLGIEVSIDGDLVVIGGSGDTLGRGNGIAIVSKRTGTTWSTPVVIKPETTFLDGFGWAVKANNEFVIVGAPYGNVTERIPGRAFLYDCTGVTPTLVETFTVRTDRTTIIQDTSMTTNDSFGWAVDVNSTQDVVLVGSINRTSRGIVYAYQKVNNVWGVSAMPDSAIVPTSQVTSGRFGSSISRTNAGFIIGAYGANSVYWFK